MSELTDAAADEARDIETTSSSSRRYVMTLWALAMVIVVADQLTKWWARASLVDSPVDVVGSLRFYLTYNTGFAFSRGEGYGTLIGVLAIVIIGVVLWVGRNVDNWISAVSLGAVVGGAAGNVVDRLFLTGPGEGFLGGAVTDFIDLQWWPVFNIADAAIVVGGAVLVLNGMRRENRADP